jgi:hypothetical protein
MSVRWRLTAALGAALLVLSGCGGLHHSRGWKLADLDRNWLNTETYRGMSDAQALASGMPHPTSIISAKGVAKRSVHHQPHPLEIVVRYKGDHDGFEAVPDECFRFTFPDGYDIDFHSVDCPKG